ncbi:MAG: hypothetical protein GQ564_15530 [Bacteroidales bacterium]|nr:hypothetical protein [Bacteroidales bacterium]
MKIFIYVVLACLLLVVVSCEKIENEFTEPSESLSAELSELRQLAIADGVVLEPGEKVIQMVNINKDLGNKSISSLNMVSKNNEEPPKDTFIFNGLTLNPKSIKTDEDITNSKSILEATEKLTFSDLEFYNASPSYIRQSFTDYFGTTPDGIAVNNETYYNAVTPAITEQEGNYCYNKVYSSTIHNQSLSSYSSRVFETYATNGGPSAVPVTKHLAYTEATGTNWNITAGSSISLEATLGFHIPFTVDAESTLTVTGYLEGSTGGSASSAFEFSDDFTVTVPAYSKQKLSLHFVLADGVADLWWPVNLEGWFGANFPNKVNDHYWWFLNYTGSGTMVAHVTDHSSVRAYITIGDVEPL